MSDIRDWLEGLGLGQFAEAFEREEINPAESDPISLDTELA